MLGHHSDQLLAVPLRHPILGFYRSAGRDTGFESRDLLGIVDGLLALLL
jgi:hypothetical protein